MGQACCEEQRRTPFQYQPRRPEKSVLYKIISENLKTFYEEVVSKNEDGFGVPSYVKEEFEAYLRCGLLQYGFARIKCAACKEEYLVAYSCKNRGVCPSCVSRRMSDNAVLLIDHVLPDVDYRQWTFSLPRLVRYKLAYNKALLTKVLTIFHRNVFSYQKRRAKKEGIVDPIPGAVGFTQRYGSLLNLNVHEHSWVPDGVFYYNEAGLLAFHYLGPPTNEELAKLLGKIRTKVLAACDLEVTEPEGEEAVMASLGALSMEVPLQMQERTESYDLSAFNMGFSLHAGLVVERKRRRKLEKCLRYATRPPFSLKRLSVTKDGKVRLKLRKTYFTGQRDVVFEPLDFMRRLAAITPLPRQNLTRYYGIFSPNHKSRKQLAQLLPQKSSNPKHKMRKEKSAPNAYRQPWSALLKRVFGDDIMKCSKCFANMKLISMIDDRAVIHKILTHLGIDPDPPPIAPARAPPQLDFEQFVDDYQIVPF